jgi:hypothetical protein
MTLNEYQSAIDQVFRNHFPTWEQVPGGDPIRVLSEALAVSLQQTEARYQSLLHRVVQQAPVLMGLRPRRATAARVQLNVVASAKNTETVVVPGGRVFSFKAADRKFEAVVVSEVLIEPGTSQLVLADWIEVLDDNQVGTLHGKCWEAIDLPTGLLEEPDTLTLRFPDETVKQLERCTPDALLQAATDLGDRFVVSPQSLLFPTAESLCRGYRASVLVFAKQLKVASDPLQLPLVEYKAAPEKNKQIAEVAVVGLETPSIGCESQAAFHERSQRVLQHALQLFYQGPALSTEELAQSLNHLFPMIRCESILIDDKSETAVITVISLVGPHVDAVTLGRVRIAAESKLSLRFEIAMRDQNREREGRHA